MPQVKLSDCEHHRHICANPDVSIEELHDVLQSVAQIRMCRKETLMELCYDERRRRLVMIDDDGKRP